MPDGVAEEAAAVVPPATQEALAGAALPEGTEPPSSSPPRGPGPMILPCWGLP